jgi:cytochrome subunit of sulfide dehydrogenase
MTAARGATCDAGSEPTRAVKQRGTAKTSGLRQIILLSIATGALIPIANRSMAADDNQGAQLAAICASCHRLDGRDKGIPSIVGLNRKQFTDIMAAFKSGESSSQIMHAIALSLSDEEVSALAAYLAALPAGATQR